MAEEVTKLRYPIVNNKKKIKAAYEAPELRKIQLLYIQISSL